MPIPTKHYETMKDETPEYYKGKNGYLAKDVISNFELSYNVGTAVTYLLRANRKHDTPIDDIRKAIHHLHFELDVLTSKTLTGALSPTGVRK
tara:strand:+ start:292 stop:567 length:276 start_codon:yes stop_codon:yes gene_type:complete